jgi:hypothetical protein
MIIDSAGDRQAPRKGVGLHSVHRKDEVTLEKEAGLRPALTLLGGAPLALGCH